MIDTIKIRLHAIRDARPDDLELAKAQLKNKKITWLPIAYGNFELYTKMCKYKKKNFSIRAVMNKENENFSEVSEDEYFMAKDNQRVTMHQRIRNVMMFRDEGEEKLINLSIRGKYRLRSDSPYINFNINENAGFIDFEFSVPKYLYGHNLAQFLPGWGTKLRKEGGAKIYDMQYHRKHLHTRTIGFIKKFFSDLQHKFECEHEIDLNYVEIRRIDLCYNQYFKNSEDAFTYLNAQKKLKYHKQRVNSDVSRNYETSINFLSSSGFYFKIYHKGTEYAKTQGDLKKHLSLNKEFIKDMLSHHNEYVQDHLYDEFSDHYQKFGNKIWAFFKKYIQEGFSDWDHFAKNEKDQEQFKNLVNKIHSLMPYKVKFLKEEMDKILRYEVSISGQALKDKYKRKVFRNSQAKCPRHQGAFDMYRKVKNAKDARTSDKRITPVQERNYKMMHDFLNTSIQIVVGDDKMNSRIHQYETRENEDINNGLYMISRFDYHHTRLADHDIGLFSDRLMRVLVDDFFAMVEKYQLKSIDPYPELVKQIQEYNNQVEIKRAQYNRQYKHLTKDAFGNQRVIGGKERKDHNGRIMLVGGKMINKATQLLTQTQLRDKDLKKMSETVLSTILIRMEKASLDQVFKDLEIPKSKQTRLKKDLAKIGVFKQTLSVKFISTDTNFRIYYNKMMHPEYRKKLYCERVLMQPKHLYI